MKKVLFLILTFLLTTSTIHALEEWQAKSLIAFEGGLGTISGSGEILENTDPFGFAGFKIGAQSTNYRVFFGARHYEIDGYDNANSFGAELQYLINFSQDANFFTGVNGGKLNIKFDSPEGARSFDATYLGMDLGLNYHMSSNLDFEIGARYLTLRADNIQQNVTYKLSNMSNLYFSFIIGFYME